MWWPSDVPWTKWGVQRGIKRFQLEKLVKEAMNYHGGRLPEPKEKVRLFFIHWKTLPAAL